MARITAEPDEARLAAARQSRRQDPEVPFLIHKVDGRLLPNTKLTRKNANYFPYGGKASDSLEVRMQYLKFNGRRRVVDTSTAEETFDVGTADATALVAFALEEYGAMLDPTQPIKKLRRAVLDLANSAGTAGPSAGLSIPGTAELGAKRTGMNAVLSDEMAG